MLITRISNFQNRPEKPDNVSFKKKENLLEILNKLEKMSCPKKGKYFLNRLNSITYDSYLKDGFTQNLLGEFVKINELGLNTVELDLRDEVFQISDSFIHGSKIKIMVSSFPNQKIADIAIYCMSPSKQNSEVFKMTELNQAKEFLNQFGD